MEVDSWDYLLQKKKLGICSEFCLLRAAVARFL